MDGKLLIALWIAFVLVLESPGATVQERWHTFIRQHIAHEHSAAHWNIGRWNSWLQDRLGPQYKKKPIDSVIISSTDTVLKSYTNQTIQDGDNLRYSDTAFTVYIFKLRSNDVEYFGLRCTNRKVLAGLAEGKNGLYPVHFHRMSGVENTCVRVR